MTKGRKVFFTALFVAVICGLFGCRSSEADTALLVASTSEFDSLRTEVRLVGQPVDLAHHKVIIGYRKGERLYIIRTGAGNLNAVMATEGLIARYKIDRVISIGVAGNLDDDWKPGDLIVATNIVSHQAGKETPDGFEVQEKSEVRSRNAEGYSQKCADLRELAMGIARLATDSHGSNPSLRVSAALREGRLVSGDSFIASTIKRKWLRETYRADAVDMVSAGIARTCEANGVPYVIIRVLSDNADENASADFAAFIQKYNQPITVEIAVRIVDKVMARQKESVAPERDPPAGR